MCGLRGLLNHKKNVASLSFTQAELCSCHYLYFEVTGDKFQLPSLGPNYLLSHEDWKIGVVTTPNLCPHAVKPIYLHGVVMKESEAFFVGARHGGRDS